MKSLWPPSNRTLFIATGIIFVFLATQLIRSNGCLGHAGNDEGGPVEMGWPKQHAPPPVKH